jgi:hypothetical protein
MELPLAEQLAQVPPGASILMDNSEYVGALQTAGVPLKQTIGPADYYGWRAAESNPAKTAAVVIAVDGDAISKMVQEHPQGLTEVSISCSTTRPCVRFYRSDEYKAR